MFLLPPLMFFASRVSTKRFSPRNFPLASHIHYKFPVFLSYFSLFCTTNKCFFFSLPKVIYFSHTFQAYRTKDGKNRSLWRLTKWQLFNNQVWRLEAVLQGMLGGVLTSSVHTLDIIICIGQLFFSNDHNKFVK